SPLSQWRLALRRFRERKSGMIGLGIVVSLILIAIFAPLIAPFPPNKVLVSEEEGVRPRDPPCVHLFGCDE
ncbi:MAG: ABC transporter permease, partial [Acidobacteria bacterium]|nr:ABC transporter permease [Acidobacteriota bacterium]NIM60583.1 ABC transporter permease [Acidobacteriota bacterium]NIO58616.1 ABC transporter permease [Acidobacteriota bacterium]NIT10331.1 ABC transporter permease [Acidobacteriota bacterium]